MSKYEEGLQIFEGICGNGKDNVIGLSTVATESSADNIPYPCVHFVDAYYENGTFYITTWAESDKMKQLSQNNNVAFCIGPEWITGNGIGENLGWVLDPKNADLRAKLRKTFAAWYDEANNEQNENCVILAIHITRCKIFGENGVFYGLDFSLH